MAKTFSMELDGIEKAIRSLGHLKQTLKNKILRKAMNQATKPLAKALKAATPTYTKTLKKSIGRKVKSYRHSGATVGIVGPRSGEKFAREVVPPGRRKARRFNPTKYAHLAEAHHGFIARTMAAQAATSQAILVREIREGLKGAMAK